jgi:hypothetical protein
VTDRAGAERHHNRLIETARAARELPITSRCSSRGSRRRRCCSSRT